MQQMNGRVSLGSVRVVQGLVRAEHHPRIITELPFERALFFFFLNLQLCICYDLSLAKEVKKEVLKFGFVISIP